MFHCEQFVASTLCTRVVTKRVDSDWDSVAWKGASQRKTIAICARSSNAEIIFCRSSSRGIWRAVKSCLTNRSENQKHCCETVRIKPPMPHTSEFANASAAANPRQRGRGRNGTRGDECSSQCWYSVRMRSEFFVKIRLSVPGSRMRIHGKFECSEDHFLKQHLDAELTPT